MDFDLSPEHQLFRQTLRSFVDSEIRPVLKEWEQAGRYPTEIVDSMKEMAARAVGVAQEAYDQALAYSNTREAFGRKISGFQAIQLKLAEMATDTQAARLLVWWAASQADQGKRVDIETAMAKYLASEVACRAALESMRIHGGMGYSPELDIERLYRDAPLMVIGEGTNDIMKMVIARGLSSGRLVID